MRHVFDLTVENAHCYYANKVLVHNCSQALRYLKDAGFLELDPPLKSEDDDDDYVDYTPAAERRRNPYD